MSDEKDHTAVFLEAFAYEFGSCMGVLAGVLIAATFIALLVNL